MAVNEKCGFFDICKRSVDDGSRQNGRDRGGDGGVVG